MGQLLSVDIDSGNMGSTVKLQKKAFALHFLCDDQLLPVAANKLVTFVISIVQGHFLHRMRQTHLLKSSSAGAEIFRPFLCKFPSVAQALHMHAPFGICFHHKGFGVEKQGNFYFPESTKLFLDFYREMYYII
jgi:hypothetical protein